MSVDGLRGRVFLRAFAGDRFAVVLVLEYTWILLLGVRVGAIFPRTTRLAEEIVCKVRSLVL